MTNAQLGRIGEQMAVRHLERAGLVVLARNWRCADGDVRGEVDVVAREGDVLVFCEVKTRRDGRAGSPLEAITPRKVARLRRLAGAYLAREGPPSRAGVRLDAVGVTWPAGGGRAQISHVRGIG